MRKARKPLRAADQDHRRAQLPQAGLYEIQAGEYLAYTDERVLHAFRDMWDAKTSRTLTQQRLNALSAIDFKELPWSWHQDGARQGHTRHGHLRDPNCGYCKKLARDLQGVNDITVYPFLVPVLVPDSQKKAETIWCAPDRSKAWQDWLLSGNAAGDQEL